MNWPIRWRWPTACLSRRVDRLNELPENERLKPEQIIATLRQRGKIANFSTSSDEILEKLLPSLHQTDVVAVFSNGKFDGIHEKLLARLAPNGLIFQATSVS